MGSIRVVVAVFDVMFVNPATNKVMRKIINHSLRFPNTSKASAITNDKPEACIHKTVYFKYVIAITMLNYINTILGN